MVAAVDGGGIMELNTGEVVEVVGVVCASFPDVSRGSEEEEDREVVIVETDGSLLVPLTVSVVVVMLVVTVFVVWVLTVGAEVRGRTVGRGG